MEDYDGTPLCATPTGYQMLVGGTATHVHHSYRAKVWKAPINVALSTNCGGGGAATH